MSIWDNVKKFAQPYSDDEYDDYDEEDEEYEEEPPRRQPQRSGRKASAPRAAAPAEEPEEDYRYEPAAPAESSYSGISSGGFSGQVLNMNTGASMPSVSAGSSSNRQGVVLFRPISFNDTPKAADDLRNHKAVVCNMENVDKALARRVVDFLSGCVYALDGDVRKIAQSAYLFCPHNMEITGDLESLQSEVENYI